MPKYPIWRKIVDAVEYYNREVSYSEIKRYVLEKWPDTNPDTITYQTIAITVNHSSRIHYPENKKYRITDGTSNYDQLYYKGRGRVEKYNPLIHGVWEILDEDGVLKVREYIRKRKTFIFIWQPAKWPWSNLAILQDKIAEKGFAIEPWSSGNTTKAINKFDRFFLLKLGDEPKGIIGSGFIKSNVYKAKSELEDNKIYNASDLQFDTILNPFEETVLSIDNLIENNLTEQEWHPRASGISLNEKYSEIVEKLWFELVSTKESFLVDDSADLALYEGTIKEVIQNRYERNSYARKLCLEYYGHNCKVCDMNFLDEYGEIGKDFIHVHHLNEISKKKGKHKVDPIKDLRPVCPNCHAMLHRKNPAYTIEQIKQIIVDAKLKTS